MSKCDACGSSKTCRYHGESKFYHKDDGTPVIALLGQPTCGYIGTQFWNQGRTQEIKERVMHL